MARNTSGSYEFTVYQNSSYIVRLGSTVNQIASWDITSTSISSGNLELLNSGRIRHTSDYWRFNNDGSGQIGYSGANTGIQ